MIEELNRQALHAHLLGFLHPSTKEYIEFTAPIPEDIQMILDTLTGKVKIDK